MTRYNFNRSYFNKPNLENCYWAGFIAADGCICERDDALIIALNDKDRSHLEKFQKCIGSDHKILFSIARGSYTNNTKCARLSMCGIREAGRDLFDVFNIGPRKTHSLKPPKLNNIKHKLAFVAGFIDGDGSVFIAKHKGLQISVGGNKDVISWIKELVDLVVPPIKERNIRLVNDHGFYEFKITAQRAKDLYKMIKKLKLPLLERKWSFNA